ncbi:MAG: ABC transporter ATP-binding protein [Bdellovibrionales bacterium]
MNIIEVKDLVKKLPTGFVGKTEVLHKISFNVPKGVACGFVGNNGAGKTTTLKCLLEFLNPDSGEIQFFGEKLTVQNRIRLGYLPERPYLYEFLTAWEFLRFHWNLTFPTLQGFDARAEEVLKTVGLFENRNKIMRKFSKGMLQRAGLAQALIHNPDLMILDEPMSGLDPDGRYMVKNILRELKNQGKTLFFSSHLLEDVDELCEYIVVIHHGNILYQGPLAAFRKQYRNLEEAFAAVKAEARA